MKKRIAVLVLAMGMCLGLATRVTNVSLAQPRDDKMQDQDKMKDNKMNDGKMDHKDKMGKKKEKKHKKDKMDKMDDKK